MVKFTNCFKETKQFIDFPFSDVVLLKQMSLHVIIQLDLCKMQHSFI